MTSCNEMLLTAMLIVYSTENAARMRFSFWVNLAGVCNISAALAHALVDTHKCPSLQSDVAACTARQRVKPGEGLLLSAQLAPD